LQTGKGDSANPIDVPMYRYRLIDREGVDLGPFASRQAEWQPGEVLFRAAGNLRVIAVVVETEKDFRAYLVVSSAE
jgi:hypothetical protein